MEQLAVGHPAIERALECYAGTLPGAVDEAREAMSVWLEGIDQSAWPSVCWDTSTLTTDGFPVEFTCSSAAEYIGYTTEVAGPDVREHARLDMAMHALSRLGAKPLPEHFLQQWTDIQQNAPLRYGTWASGRHGAGAARYKIYVEVPPAEPAVARTWAPALREWPRVGGEPALLRMIGFDAATARTELYFRIDAGERWQLARMLRQMGFGRQAQDLLGFAENTSGRSLDNGALGRNVGCSVAFSAGGEPEAAAVFGFAWAVFRGGDGAIRDAVLSQAGAHGWPLEAYRALSEPAACFTTRRTHHGMASFTITAAGQTAFQIGIRPPDPCKQTYTPH